MRKTAVAVLITALFCFSSADVMLANWANANPIAMFPKEPEPLIVTFLSPKNGSRCLQDSLTIAFSLKNPTLGGADSITYIIDGQTRGNVKDAITGKEGERFVGFFDLLNYSATLGLAGLSDGWHTLTVAAAGTSPYNPEGGMGAIFSEVSGSDSVQFLFDVATPTVTVLIQQNQTYTTTDVPLNFTLSEKVDWVGYSLDEQPLVTIAGNTSLVGLSEGPHSLKVYANDTVGRRGNSETIFFVVEQTEEVVTNQPESESFPMLQIVAVSVAVAALVAAGILVCWKKRKRNVDL